VVTVRPADTPPLQYSGYGAPCRHKTTTVQWLRCALQTHHHYSTVVKVRPADTPPLQYSGYGAPCRHTTTTVQWLLPHTAFGRFLVT